MKTNDSIIIIISSIIIVSRPLIQVWLVMDSEPDLRPTVTVSL